MKQIFKELCVGLFSLLLTTSTWAQTLGPSQYAQTSVLFTSTGATNWVVPQNVTVVYIDAISGGQGGAGGQSTAGAGGGGGSAGSWCQGFALNVTPGATLVVTVGLAGLGTAAGVAGGIVSLTTSISGAQLETLTLNSNGTAPTFGAAGTGGTGGASVASVGLAGGAGGNTTTAGSNGGTLLYPGLCGYGAPGGGAGGSNGTTGKNGGGGGGTAASPPGSGGVVASTIGGGGGGGSSPWGTGGSGGTTAGGGAGTGYGSGGGGGSGTGTAAGANGTQGFLQIRY